MAQQLTILVPLARHRTGLSLRAQLRDTAGVAVGSLVSSGFSERGQGHYEWFYAAYPDGFEGAVDFTISGAPTVNVATVAVNNADFGATTSTSVAAIAAAVWAYATRTLTQSAASVLAALTGSSIAIRRGDTASVSLTGLGNITSRTKLWFTVKESEHDTDAAAKIQIVEGTGLVYLNGAAGSSGQGSITVTNATTGALTIALAAAATAQLELQQKLYWDVQYLSASGVQTIAEGTLKVVRDASRSIT